MTKSEMYDHMATQLAPYWERDGVLLDEHSALWKQAREIDDWLCQYKEDDRVSVEQYARNCQRLIDLYRGDAWRLMRQQMTA